MRIIQINLYRSNLASLALMIRLAAEQPDCVLIQEPWVNEELICGLRTIIYTLKTAKVRLGHV